ncbi:MAG: MtnX-like HAD-IB family phosphatase [Candidatus Omnitrophica bacterium]|nr:MtnX-like HAD-IB family phosphatase [Candidatus Omnitrophota bacterium]
MEKKLFKFSAAQCAVFFDFDNTIASCDVLDNILPLFSSNKHWIELEKLWQEGKIGSLKCLYGQLKGVRITKKALNEYLSGIKIDPCFDRLVSFLKERRVKTAVLSDNFDYILKNILKRHSIKGLKVYSNKLEFSKDRLIPQFPYQAKKCRICAHCKTKNLLANSFKNSIIIYVGDGRSDICPAKYADIVFAKDSLLEYCIKNKLNYLPYKNLNDVYGFLKRSLNGNKTGNKACSK